MTLYERYITGDDVHSNIQSTTWDAQSFTVGNTGANQKHKVTSVKLKVFREGSPGTFTVGIRTVDGEGKPSDDELCSVDYNGNNLPESATWVEFTFASPATLVPSTQYTIVARAPGGDVDNHVSWRLDLHGTYTGGCNAISYDGDETWQLESARDLMFEEYGQLVVSGVIRLGTSIVLMPVGAIIPSAAGAEQKQLEGTNHSYYVLAFDKTTVEKADWQFLMPSSYDEGNVKVQIFWVATSTTGGVVFDVNFGNAGDSDSCDPAISTQPCDAVTVDGISRDINISSCTILIPFNAGEYAIIRIHRETGDASDTMDGDAEIIGVIMQWV